MKKVILTAAVIGTLLTGCGSVTDVVKTNGTVLAIDGETYVVECNGRQQSFKSNTSISIKEGQQIYVWQFADGWFALSDPAKF